MLRLAPALLLASSLFAADPFTDSIRPILQQSCASCHNSKSPQAGFNIESLFAEPSKHHERWDQIARRIRSGEMPPKGAPPLETKRSQAVLSWIDSSFEAIRNPGRVTARRLNRFEYANSVRDLLGIDMQPANGLPPDPYGYGFDNIGDVLSINASLTELYLKSAERIAQAAIPIDSEPLRPVMHRYLAERVAQDRQLHLRIDHSFPADGEYTLRSAFYQALKDGTKVRMRLFLDGREAASDVLSFYYQIDRAVEGRGISVTAGRHRVEATIDVLPDPPYKDALPYLEYVQIYGPLKVAPAAQTEVYRRFFTCSHAPGQHVGSCARRILEPLASKAWRRPVVAGELDQLLSLAHKEQARTKSFEQAMRTSLEAILLSPNFLFRIERDRGQGSQPLTPYELSTRLSYFLWSSIPDESLLKLAAQGTLGKSLREQATRMLESPKSSAFIESFAGQWLQLRNLSVLKPDPTRFPAFTGELADDMRKETELFFTAMLKENRPIPDMLDANFTFLNERLARHYGIEGIKGDEFRRVQLDGAQRGGILAHASILTVSSYPTRTSPVIRGKWILENILNQPPPPPPADVPALDEKDAASATSMRQQLEKHRANAACAGCHARMDPLGFGLENYDAIGRWRSVDGGAPVDPSGVLPSGAKFTTPSELKSILKADKDTITLALTEKMLTYATGRGMEASDRATIRSIAARVRDKGYSMRQLIFEVVESEPFRLRNSQIQSGVAP